MEQRHGYGAARDGSTDRIGLSLHSNGYSKPLPPFHHVCFYKGDKLLFRKSVNNMAKPKISLKIGGLSNSSSIPSTPTAPLPTPGGSNKIRISLGGASKAVTPSEPIPKPSKTKAGRAPKPSAKLVASKKRPNEDSDLENETITVKTEARANPKKKIKFSLGAQTPKTPIALKAKFRGKPPKRPLGEGYDSEASDREEDPTIEEEWVLRMLPGEDCEYVRQMITERRVGLPRSQGGAEISFKFLHNDGRRAVVSVRGHLYAATMVDLPCVIEGMKSWDKKGWYKSADICQMLLVFAPIKHESEAETIELPKLVDPTTFQYPHGLTAPMHNARKRRFRKRIRREAIEAVEEAVEKLLAADAEASDTRYEMIEPDLGSRTPGYGSPRDSEREEEYSPDEEDDAEGEEEEEMPDYFGNGAGQLTAEPEDDGLEADLEAAFEADALQAGTPMSQTVADASMIMNGEGSHLVDREDSGDESLEDDDDDGDGSDDEIDEDEKARNAELEGAREDIADMEKQLEGMERQLNAQSNPILKTRIRNNIEKVKAELQLKKSAIGEGDED